MTEQEKFMKEAIRQAKKAYLLEEVPIGCVIVHEGKIHCKEGTTGETTDRNTALPCRTDRYSQGSKEAGRLETGRMHHVCDSGTMSRCVPAP